MTETKPAKKEQKTYKALVSIVLDGVQYSPDQVIPESEGTARLIELKAIEAQQQIRAVCKRISR